MTTGKVIATAAMSLDVLIADPSDAVGPLFPAAQGQARTGDTDAR